MSSLVGGGAGPDPRAVFVVRGRSMAARNAMFQFLRAIFLLAAGAAAAFAQDAGAVRATLSLSSDKKVFRAGEPIRLVMSFTSERGGYQLNDTTTKPPSAVDAVTVSPDAGAHAWAAEYTGGGYHPDYALIRDISRTPTTVELTLNDWYRFDRAGRYTVKVTTSRVSGPGARMGEGPAMRLTTNEVSFEVVEMSGEEEAAEVKRLSALLDTAKGWQEEARLAEELSYLAGGPSTREKVRRFLAGSRTNAPGNFAQNIILGLAVARDRALVVRLLEAAIRDPEVIPSHGLLATTSSLKLTLEGVPRPALTFVLSPQAQNPRVAEVMREYVSELVASLPKRKGKSRTAAAMTVLTNLPRDERGNVSAAPPAVRDVLVGEFDSLHPFDQEYLLRVYWEVLRDPSLPPSLERMLAPRGGQSSYQTRGQALRRLLELSPDRARPYVLAELRDPSSVVDYEVLAALRDEALPEADDALLAQLKALAPQARSFDVTLLQHKTKLAARYASAGVYDALLEVYRAWGEKWQPDARGALLGYFARYNEAQAAPLAEQALAQMQPGQDLSFLLGLTRVGYPEAVRGLLHRRLEGDDPQAAGTAAYVMSQHGSEADERLIESRLERWRKEWAGRAAELDAAGSGAQRMAEINLVEALLRSKVWKLSEGKATSISRGCVSEECRRRYAPK